MLADGFGFKIVNGVITISHLIGILRVRIGETLSGTEWQYKGSLLCVTVFDCTQQKKT